MSKLAVKYRDVGDLVPYANNARTHSDEQIAQIAASIKEFNFTNPVLLDGENGILAGHGRVLAAKQLGMKQVPCIDLAGFTKAQRRAYILADNRLAENAGWDLSLLRSELSDLQAMEFDLDLIGFTNAELVQFMAHGDQGLTDPDEVPEAPEAPVTQPGDVWLLGNHRLVCGDSTNADDVAKCLAGAEPHLMVTDPPYGVEYDAGWRDEAAKHSPSMGNRKDTAKGVVENDDRADWSAVWRLFPGDVIYAWHSDRNAGEGHSSLTSCGFVVRCQIIWVKNHMVVGRGDYQSQHEPCWYAVRKNCKGHFAGDRKQVTVWEIDKPKKSETGHSTQKPIECMKRPIENNSKPGDQVYEPFSGSGTTIIAAEMTGRACFAIEISPTYVDVAIQRWQAFTGREAVLEATEQTFAEVADDRAEEAA